MKAKYVILFFTLLGLTVTAAAQEQIAIPLSNPGEPGQFNISVVRGAINVSGHDGNEVIIRYDNGEERREEPDEVRNGLRRITNNAAGFEAWENNNTVEVSSVTPTKNIKFDVLVPRNFSLKLSLVNGDDMMIENVEGDMEINHVNGDVVLNNVSGSAVVNTVNGNITASFQSIARDKPMAFSNVNGDISITLPSNANLTAKMWSEWGEVYTDFDMEMRQEEGSRVNSGSGTYKVSVNNWINAEINGGGPEYLFKSLRGDIYIRKG
ncbi:MAG: DUF4097 family beta strand repeat-containing protein [Balneolaceae bacterium]